MSRFSTGNCHLARILWGIFFFFSRLCCPLKFQNSQWANLWEGLLFWGNFSYVTTPSPGGGLRPCILCLFLSLYVLSYLISKRLGCLSGYLRSSAGAQSCFVEAAPRVGNLLMCLWGREWCPCCSSAILGPPPRDYRPKWRESRLERQTSYDTAYVWNLRKIQMKLSTKQKQTHRHRKQTWFPRWEMGGGEDFRSLRWTYTHYCKWLTRYIDTQQEINIYTLLYITDKIYRYPTRDKHIHTPVYNWQDI